MASPVILFGGWGNPGGWNDGWVGSGGAAPAGVPAVTLPVAPYAFYGTVKLSTYGGTACCDVVRASDSATQTIGFVNGQIDMAAATAFAAGSALTVSKWYDQSGAGRDAVQPTSTIRAKLNALNVVNGIQAIGYDGSNGIPLITCAFTAPLVLDIQNLAFAMVGRMTSSSGSRSDIVSLHSATPAQMAEWVVFSGLSYVATTTQTNAIYIPVNPASIALSRGANSGATVAGTPGQNYLTAERQAYRGGASATTGTGTSASGVIGNNFADSGHLFAEVVTIAIFNTEQSLATMQAIQAALEAPFPTPIQRTFADTLTLFGDSIGLGTGTTFNQSSLRQIEPLLKRPVRMFNLGIFGGKVNDDILAGTGSVTPVSGWTQTTKICVNEKCSNDFAVAGTSQGLAAKPTIAAGGSGYATSSTFNLTTAGGTGTQAIISVTTNSSGVVTTVNSMTNFGSWSALPSTPNTPTGGTGSGCTLNLTFALLNSAVFVRANMIQFIANAKSGGQNKVLIGNCIPRKTWITQGATITGSVSGTTLTVGSVTSGTVAIGQNINVAGTPGGRAIITGGSGTSWTLDTSLTIASQTIICGSAAWVQGCAYNADSRANFASWGADGYIDSAADTIMGDIFSCNNATYYNPTDGLHPGNAGWARLAPIYATAINAQMP